MPTTAQPRITSHQSTDAKHHVDALTYSGRRGLDDFLRQMYEATPMQTLETERKGVSAAILNELARRMELPTSYIAMALGISKVTAHRKIATGKLVDGRPIVGLVKLLALAQEIVDESTSSQAEHFDTVKWLGQWIVRPQPALGGYKPAELLDATTGITMVAKVLGAIRSGAYQ
ncbi:MAG: antitoxin Xre/MbcA/ParS toxin-binding domain-containing protein [Hydrogenophaga sp.]|uniref:antitoxin Xre/MbcA/ParS toxin-binding domain-containing protein n=1 Tax=Comamonadaceae TaxID=80864 RepID=UPI00272FBDB1|nr:MULTISPECIES: antitoxin Xre/MbcA/ParS toxin-binding domain-containing protein [Comamonadaceae]MDP2440205.1 DUF2384 domain-containing protein [Rhodoferax sp.]MDZ4174359.1 antitoxin Xre/MbcA/ParS toxin-binding domain-containing protein [Hydrogenophaga sp.]